MNKEYITLSAPAYAFRILLQHEKWRKILEEIMVHWGPRWKVRGSTLYMEFWIPLPTREEERIEELQAALQMLEDI